MFRALVYFSELSRIVSKKWPNFQKNHKIVNLFLFRFHSLGIICKKALAFSFIDSLAIWNCTSCLNYGIILLIRQDFVKGINWNSKNGHVRYAPFNTQ